MDETAAAAGADRPEAAPRPPGRPALPETDSPGALGQRAWTASVPALLLAAVVLLPMAGKAFTIDDTLFLRQAEWALRDPLHPLAVTMVWSEVPRPMRLSQVMPSGPLMAWLLVPSILAGGSEIVAHLLQLLLLGASLLAVSALALRLGFDDTIARWSALLLASTPAVLGMAGTAMPDVAAMAFGLVGIERLCAWRQNGRLADAVLASLALALAPLARGHVVLLLGLAPFLLERPWRPGKWRSWLPVVAAPVITLAIVAVTRDPEGGSADLVRSAGYFSSLANVRSNAIAFGVHWILVLPLGLAWMIARGRRFWWTPLPYLGVAAAVAVLAGAGDARWLWIAPVAGLGVAVVADVVVDAVRRREQTALALGLWLLVALPIVVYLHFPSKYLVVCAPAAAILSASAMFAMRRPVAVRVASGLVAAGATLGVLILQADANFAGLGRRAVEELVVPRVAAGERVWFNVNWGFQWYAERAGATILTSTPPYPKAGDLVVSARETVTGIPVARLARRELVASVADSTSGGRIMSSRLGAGFYSNGWGYLPWVWGSTEIDRFDLWRLR